MCNWCDNIGWIYIISFSHKSKPIFIPKAMEWNKFESMLERMDDSGYYANESYMHCICRKKAQAERRLADFNNKKVSDPEMNRMYFQDYFPKGQVIIKGDISYSDEFHSRYNKLKLTKLGWLQK